MLVFIINKFSTDIISRNYEKYLIAYYTSTSFRKGIVSEDKVLMMLRIRIQKYWQSHCLVKHFCQFHFNKTLMLLQ